MAEETQKRSTKKPGANAGQVHAHGCVVCSRRYTDSCAIPDVNGRCSKCRTGRERAQWDSDFDPRDCCRKYARPAEKADLVAHSLGGPGPWYICREHKQGCARTHPYDPRRAATPAPSPI